MEAIRRSIVSDGRTGMLPSKRCQRRHLSVVSPAFDITLAAAALLAFVPLLILIALLIRLDSQGPVLFRQTRTGLNGRQFRIYKFRTMRVQEDGSVVRQAPKGDSRVTRIGSSLCKTSLDELPQLLNVLRVEIALVGPRPHALAHDVHYGAEIAAYNSRFAVKSGITGGAQINGSRGETPTLAHIQHRTELDLWYIEHRILGLYLQILFSAVLAETTRRTNAY